MSDNPIKNISQFIKALKASGYVKVGVSQGTRSDGLTNEEVGTFHEFGTTSLPVRSFLRMPLTEKLEERLTKANLFSEPAIKKILETGSVHGVLVNLGIQAEAVVGEAFDSGGFGNWAPHAPGYTNATGDILVDTAQLRKSITSEVVS